MCTTLVQESKKELPLMLNCEQTASMLNCHARTIARMCERGDLLAVKVGSHWRVNRDALYKFAGWE